MAAISLISSERCGQASRPVVDPAFLLNLSMLNCPLDQFVAEQCNHTTMHEKGLGVAIPIHARCATTIVLGFFWVCVELSYLSEPQTVVPQEKNRRRLVEQVAMAGTHRNTDWQSQHSSILILWLVEESMAPEFTL